jgi:hypothetical protein
MEGSSCGLSLQPADTGHQSTSLAVAFHVYETPVAHLQQNSSHTELSRILDAIFTVVVTLADEKEI